MPSFVSAYPALCYEQADLSLCNSQCFKTDVFRIKNIIHLSVVLGKTVL